MSTSFRYTAGCHWQNWTFQRNIINTMGTSASQGLWPLEVMLTNFLPLFSFFSWRMSSFLVHFSVAIALDFNTPLDYVDVWSKAGNWFNLKTMHFLFQLCHFFDFRFLKTSLICVFLFNLFNSTWQMPWQRICVRAVGSPLCSWKKICQIEC